MELLAVILLVTLVAVVHLLITSLSLLVLHHGGGRSMIGLEGGGRSLEGLRAETLFGLEAEQEFLLCALLLLCIGDEVILRLPLLRGVFMHLELATWV